MLRARALSLLLLASLALAACGGARGEERAVRDAIDAALTGTSPRDCTAPYTRAFLDQGSFGLRGLADEYVAFCRAHVAALAARSVHVEDVAVEGDRARARFTADGGAYAVRSASVKLRRVAGRWRLDRLTALSLDRARWARQQARAARLADSGVSATQAACVARRLTRVPDGELERGIVDGDAGMLADPLLVCAVRPQLRAAGLSLVRTRCVGVYLRRDPARLVRRMLDRTAASRRALERAFARAGAACR